MAYDLPDEIQYSRKYLLGLGLKRFFLIIVVPIACATVFLVFFRNPLILFLGIFSALVGWRKWDEEAIKILKYYSSWNTAEYPSKKVMEFPEIENIRNNVVVRRNGDRVALIRAEPLNLKVRDDDGIDQVYNRFWDFANGLEYPVEIYVRSVDSSARFADAFQTLEEETIEKYAELSKDYRNHFKQKVEESNEKTKQFYVVVKVSIGESTTTSTVENHSQAVEELNFRIENVSSLLDDIGIETERLEDDDLLSVAAQFFNEEVDDANKLKHPSKLGHLSAEEVKDDVLSLVSPGFVDERPYEIKINDTLNRVILAKEYPSEIQDYFFSDIYNVDADFDLSFRIEPYDIEEAITKLNKYHNSLEGRIISLRESRFKFTLGDSSEKSNSKKQVQESLKNKKRDVEDIISKVEGKQKLFDVSINLNVRGRNEEELENNYRRLKGKLKGEKKIITRTPYYKKKKAYKSVNPFSKYRLNNDRFLATEHVSKLFPFEGNKFEEEGIIFGTEKEGENPIIRDFFSLMNKNFIVVGASGAGKSYTTKLLLMRYMYQGVRCNVIDPHGEYGGIVKALGGQEVKISPFNMINPFDMMDLTYQKKVDQLEHILGLMLGGDDKEISHVQTTAINKLIKKTYERYGIYQNQPSSWEGEMPKMEDFYEVVKEERQKEETDDQTYKSLMSRAELYVNGTKTHFNTETTIDTDSDIVAYNIENMTESDSKICMTLILQKISSDMQNLPKEKRKLTLVDEAWQLMRDESGGKFLKNVYKSGRKYNMSIGIITQGGDELNSELGKKLRTNAAGSIIMRQDDETVDDTVKAFTLNDKQRDMVSTANQGEGILKLQTEKGPQYIPFEGESSEKEHQIIKRSEQDEEETSEEELLSMQDKKEKAKENDRIFEQNFPEKDFYKVEKLNHQQKQTLQNDSEWEEDMTNAFGKGRGKKAYVRTKGVVSAKHQRFVQEIKDFLDDEYDIDAYESRKKADIEFTGSDGKKIGIEIETGSNLGDTEKLKEKMERNNEEYDKWITVLTNYGEHKEKYSKIFGSSTELWKRTKFEEKIEGLI